VAVSHSGSFEKMRTPEIHPVFGNPQQDARLRHAADPFYLAELAMCRWPTERPFLYLDCGLSDTLLEGNRRFAAHLHFLGYPYSYREMPGYHTWPYWNRAIRIVLPTIAQKIMKEKACRNSI
jgi:S-formylglutathione hydrolase FrmB